MDQATVRISSDSKDICHIVEVLKLSGKDQAQLEKIESYLKDELSDLGENRVLFLLSSLSQPVGVVQLVLNRADGDPELADGNRVAHVHALQIATPFRRQGLAERLMAELEAYANKAGFQKLTLGVDEDNSAARALYEKLGYQVLKVVEGRTPTAKLFYQFKELD